jgi:hypothetical protein
VAVYTGLLVPMISGTLDGESDNDRFMKSMLTMTAFGVGEITGGLCIG